MPDLDFCSAKEIKKIEGSVDEKPEMLHNSASALPKNKCEMPVSGLGVQAVRK